MAYTGKRKILFHGFFCQKFTTSLQAAIHSWLLQTNELDTQIYGTFSGVGAVPQVKAGAKDSLKASSGKHLRELLSSEHRYLFTLIHKFNFEEEITKRNNIIVISDEAHRTQRRSIGNEPTKCFLPMLLSLVLLELLFSKTMK